MRNRAKCKLCNDIIESKERFDYVACSCGEISLVGGEESFGCGAKNWDNFLRVDDDGNEFKPQVIEKGDVIEAAKEAVADEPPTIRGHVEALVKTLNELPPGAMTTPITHYDFHSILLIVLRIIDAIGLK